MAAPEGDLTLLHVIDEEFVDGAVAAGLGTVDECDNVSKSWRKRASLRSSRGLDAGAVNIEKMIVVGLPFVEILKIARDLDLPMIVMGIRGQSTPAEELFGSTAEKVLRGTRVPVLCVPF